MALIAEVWSDSPIFMKTLARTPQMTVTLEDVRFTERGTVRGYYWATGEKFEAFEEAIDRDPTVTNPRRITDVDSRKLYRVEYTDAGVNTVPDWGDLDITLVEGEATHEGWNAVIRYPDRETIKGHFDAERAIGNRPELVAVYQEGEANSLAESVLTPAQRQALVTAFEAGYYDIPRTVSQAELASTLNISEQSLSERLRRGVGALVDSSLVAGPS